MKSGNSNNLLSQEEIDDLLSQDDKSLKDNNMDEKLEMILDFPLEVSVRIGSTRISIDELLRLSTGSVVEFDRFINEPLDLLVNDKLVARGEVITIGENFGIKITSIVGPEERIKQLG